MKSTCPYLFVALIAFAMAPTSQTLAQTTLCGNYTTNGSGQSFANDVTLTCDTTITDTGGGNISFGGSVNGDANISLTIVTDGDVTTTGTIGTPTRIESLSITANNVTLGGSLRTYLGLTVVSNTLAVSDILDLGGNLDINVSGGGIAQSAAWTVLGTSTLQAGTFITLANTGNHFTGAVSLANAGSNAITLDNGGHALALGNIDMDTGGLALQNYGSDVTLTGVINTAGVAVGLTGAITVSGSSVAINTDKGVAAGGANVWLSGPVNAATAGSDNLTVHAGTGGAVTLGGLVGGVKPLGNLDFVADTTVVTSTGVTTSGLQNYGGDLVINNAATLNSNGLTVTGTVDSSGGSPLDLTVNAGSGAVNFGSAVGDTFKLANLSINSAGPITLNGNVTTSGTQNYGGNLLLGNNVTLATTNAVVDIGGTVDNASATATSLTINNGIADTTLTGAVGSGNGALTSVALNGTGAISLGGNISTTGAQNYAGAVTLAHDVTASSSSSGNITFSGTVDSGHALTVNTGGTTEFDKAVGGATALTGLATDASGDTHLHANVSTAGVQSYGDALNLFAGLTLDSGNGAISLADVSNQAGGAINLTLTAGTGTALFNGKVCASGCTGAINLDVNAGGGISDGAGGELHVDTASLNAGNGAIILDNANNDFQGNVNATGAGVAITDAGNLGINSLTDNGNGIVNLIAGGQLTVPASINAGSGNITLASNGGSLTTGALNGSNIGLTGASGIVLNGNVTAAGALDLTTTNAAINQSGGIISASGITHVFTASGSIALAQANDFGAAVNLTGGTVQINDFNALTLGTLATGALTATSGNDLNLGQGTVGGNLSAISTSGSIGQTDALVVSGTSALSAGGGAINLVTPGNDFTVSVSASGTGVSITDSNDLTLTSLSDNGNGNVALIAGGLLNLPGAINAGTGNITLAANGGSLTTAALSGINIDLTGASGLTLGGNVTAAGTLKLQSSNAAISQTSGVTSAAGITSIHAGSGNVTLDAAGNDFQGLVNLTGGDMQVVDANSLSLGVLTTNNLNVDSTGALNLGQGNAGGTLTAASHGGAITQNGDLVVVGASSFDAGAGAITLTSTGNDFQQAMSLAGGNVQILDATALSLSTLATGNLAVTSTGALDLGSGTVTGTLTATSNNGAMSQSGVLTVTGAAMLDAGNGTISLPNANQFTSLAAITANGITINNAQGLAINGALDAHAGMVAITAAGAVSIGSGATLALTVPAHTTGQTFTVVDGSSLGGTFASATINGGNSGETLGIHYTSTSAVVAAVAGQTITITAPATMVLGGSAISITATASSGLPVTVTSTTPSICSVTGTDPTFSVSASAVGTCTIQADQAGDATHTATSASVDINVVAPSVPVPALGRFGWLLLATLMLLIGLKRTRPA